MNIDVDLAKVLGWIVAGLAGVLMFFFKRELSGIDNHLTEINTRLERNEKETASSIQKLEVDISINKQNIALNSVKDEEFKKFLNEKFDRLFSEIDQLKRSK